MMRVLFVTTTREEAEPLLRKLLEERLVGCGNILAGARSLYWWDGRIQEDEEAVLFMETSADRAGVAMEMIRRLHSYDTPKILCLPVEASDADYKAWLEESLRGGSA